MSENFENIASPSLPEVGMADPNNTSATSESEGMVKKATDMSGPSGEPLGNIQNKGVETDYTPTAGSSGYNIGEASIETFGDPNGSSAGFPAK